MVERPSYVVDATVIGKWFLHESPDERHSAQALALLADFHHDRAWLTAPYHLEYEVPSLLCKAVGSNRLPPEKALEAMTTFFAYRSRIPTVRARRLAFRAYQHVVDYQCSYYDALYLALSSATNRPFLYADDKLRRTLRRRFPLELWIEDYRPLA